MSNLKYTDQQLAEAVEHSASISGVLRYLGIRVSGSMHSHLTRRIKSLGLDTSHFTGQAHMRGQRATARIPVDQYLRVWDTDRRLGARRLREAMFEAGFIAECSICSISEWLGEPLLIEIDHINGNWLDNRRENLRFLCPNCHSQQETTKRKKLGLVSQLAEDAR